MKAKKKLKTQSPKIKKVRLTKAKILHIETPPDHAPLVFHAPDHVRVVSVPKEESWWDYLFGTKKY